VLAAGPSADGLRAAAGRTRDAVLEALNGVGQPLKRVGRGPTRSDTSPALPPGTTSR
jgi:hypothetical protein